ncbi:hypothetical protein SLS58_008143 [Diplodia intermedia]|uniref:FAD-binding domain-containing protein n=1 Tax=Diplodia intermedia TaxID=856260 RepID=A0ABR3TIF2_9PEZI
MFSSTPRIAIIGAGPAGLCLASLLQLHSISSTIFEKDTSAAHRATAGGCLDLHESSGQAALREAGLWDEFQRLARYDGQAYIISDETGQRYVDMDAGEDLGRPEIDRPHLRRMLLDSLQPGTVRWGHKLSRAELDGTLYFDVTTISEDNSTASTSSSVIERNFDLVVGADGAWSKIRALLTTVPPFYSGLTGYELWLPNDIDQTHPAVSRLAGNGSHFAFGADERCLALQRQTDRGVQVYAFLRKHEGWHDRNGVVDHADLEQVRACLLEEYAGWAEEFKDVLRAAGRPVIPRNMYMVHVGTRWLHRKGFTAIGDAAHLMTPFAGEGVNQALHDALMLAREIGKAVGGGDGVDGTVAAVDKAAERYERDMFPRASAFMQATWDSVMERFEPGGNEKFAEGFRSLAEERKKGGNDADGGMAPDVLFRRK